MQFLLFTAEQPLDHLNRRKLCSISVIVGCVKCLEKMCSHIDRPMYGLQCTVNTPTSTIPDMASHYIRVSRSPSKLSSFNIEQEVDIMGLVMTSCYGYVCPDPIYIESSSTRK